MFALRNRFRKSTPQQLYNIHIRAKKTYLDDYNVPNGFDRSNNNLNYINSQDSSSLNYNNQQLNINSKAYDLYYNNNSSDINPEADDLYYNDNSSDINPEFDDLCYNDNSSDTNQEFDDLCYNDSDSGNIYSRDEFYTDIDSSLDNKCDSTSTSTNVNNSPKIFDGTRFNL
ncbi:4528_t:CDS:2, partial [Dentiscutata erythropus]